MTSDLTLMDIVNPATGAVISRIEKDSAWSIESKATQAREAQKGWAQTPLEHRLSVIERFGAALERDKERLARTTTSESGKPISQARREIGAVGERIRYFLENTPRALAPEIVSREGGMEERITQEPLGVIANISAWNYPYFVGVNVFVPALLTGNAVLYKPSEHASLTGIAIAELLHQAGVPKPVFAPILGEGEEGSLLLGQAIDGVFFTGSYSTGRKIAVRAAPRLIRMQLELGGKDPAYVTDQVDIAAAATSLADGAFYNTGQSCCAVERIYVHQEIYSRFVEAFVEEVKRFRMGDPMDEKTYIGPVVRKAHLAFLQRQVDEAATLGGHVLCGGRQAERAGFFFEPTVIVHASPAMALMREESFGPVIGIQSVASDAEAIDLMNDSEYGLTAAVYSRERERAARVLSEVTSGTAYWNCCDRVSPRLPWSGRKHSGIGVTLSRAGIDAFLAPRAWHLRE